ncbi:MAG: hypothetical protein KBT33_14090 [Prevotellaceae bacterium]|nr:hypothetical protein [Candidatus Minthosoma equi]
MLCANRAHAAKRPKLLGTYIELRYDEDEMRTATDGFGFSTYRPTPYTYFWLRDIYTDQEKKIGSEAISSTTTAFAFGISHPIYNEISAGSNHYIPFYVEPGDSIIINVSRSGAVKSYKRMDGKEMKCLNLLLHDISNRTFYTLQDYESDSKGATLNVFQDKVMRKMSLALDSVMSIAEKYEFSEKERRIAEANTKLQFLSWIMEGIQNRSSSVATISKEKESGWQSNPYKDRDIDDLNSYESYYFMRQLPLKDTLCMASKHFSHFIQNYQYSPVLNHDQYLYYGNSLSQEARMDSAIIAKDKIIMGSIMPSLYMSIVLKRRHLEPDPVDDAIRLQEVQVIGRTAQDFGPALTAEDLLRFKLNSRPSYNFLSPTYWLYDRKREKTRERVKGIIKQMDDMDERDNAEREAVMKAYEEETSKQK